MLEEEVLRDLLEPISIRSHYIGDVFLVVSPAVVFNVKFDGCVATAESDFLQMTVYVDSNQISLKDRKDHLVAQAYLELKDVYTKYVFGTGLKGPEADLVRDQIKERMRPRNPIPRNKKPQELVYLVMRSDSTHSEFVGSVQKTEEEAVRVGVKWHREDQKSGLTGYKYFIGTYEMSAFYGATRKPFDLQLKDLQLTEKLTNAIEKEKCGVKVLR